MVSMNRLSTTDRVRVLNCLVEGVGVNATCRMTGVAKNTVLKLLADTGTAAAAYMDEHLRNLKCKRVQCDEIWSFVAKKQRNVPAEQVGQFGIGDVWTWTALDADSKLIVSYLVGLRDGGYATAFMQDVASRIANRVQLTTDGHRAYLQAVEDAFGGDVDYAQLIKVYGPENPGAGRYSPPACIGVRDSRRHGRAGPAARQHQLRRAVQPDHADDEPAVHPADERLLQEGREPPPTPSPCSCSTTTSASCTRRSASRRRWRRAWPTTFGSWKNWSA